MNNKEIKIRNSFILFTHSTQNEAGRGFKQNAILTRSTNPGQVRATCKAATRDLMNLESRIAYGEVDRLSCLFAKMQFPYLN